MRVARLIAWRLCRIAANRTPARAVPPRLAVPQLRNGLKVKEFAILRSRWTNPEIVAVQRSFAPGVSLLEAKCPNSTGIQPGDFTQARLSARSALLLQMG